MKVLLVAGSPGLADQVDSALSGRPDVELRRAATPRHALRLLDAGETFDLLLADNDTHPTGGFALAQDLHHRAGSGRPALPVVLLVARRQDVGLSGWAGSAAYVLKPVDPFDLAEVAEAVAAGRAVPSLPGVGAPALAETADRPAGVTAGPERSS